MVQNQGAEKGEQEAGLHHEVEDQGVGKEDLGQEASLDQEVEEGKQEADQDHQTDQE